MELLGVSGDLYVEKRVYRQVLLNEQEDEKEKRQSYRQNKVPRKDDDFYKRQTNALFPTKMVYEMIR